MLEIDPIAGTVRQIGEDIEGQAKYFATAVAGNGRLYAPPYHAGRVLEIDPIAGTVRQIGEDMQAPDKYVAIAAAGNGFCLRPPAWL